MRLPFVFLIALSIFAILVDLYILNDIRSYLTGKRKRTTTTVYLILMALCYGLLVAMMCIPVRDESSEILIVMWMLYSFLSIYIPKAVYVIFSLAGRITAVIRRRMRNDRRKILHNYGAVAGIPIGIAVFVGLWCGVLFTRKHIEVNKVEITSARLPKSFDGYKIVQFSDIHVGTWGNDTTFVSRFVDSVNNLNPDLILFTGDIVNRRTEELKPFMPVLKRLKAKDGVYSVLGNHDYGDYIDWEKETEHVANRELLKKWEGRMDWKMLNNEHAFISKGNDSIVLIGVENWGEPPFPAYGKLKEAYPMNVNSKFNLNDSRFKILLTHNPEHWTREVTKISNIDLSLAGHTHAMQMMMNIGGWKFSPSVFKYKRWGGLYEEANKKGEPMQLYVNIGAGEVGMPARFGSAYPEITEITLRRR